MCTWEPVWTLRRKASCPCRKYIEPRFRSRRASRLAKVPTELSYLSIIGQENSLPDLYHGFPPCLQNKFSSNTSNYVTSLPSTPFSVNWRRWHTLKKFVLTRCHDRDWVVDISASNLEGIGSIYGLGAWLSWQALHQFPGRSRLCRLGLCNSVENSTFGISVCERQVAGDMLNSCSRNLLPGSVTCIR